MPRQRVNALANARKGCRSPRVPATTSARSGPREAPSVIKGLVVPMERSTPQRSRDSQDQIDSAAECRLRLSRADRYGQPPAGTLGAQFSRDRSGRAPVSTPSSTRIIVRSSRAIAPSTTATALRRGTSPRPTRRPSSRRPRPRLRWATSRPSTGCSTDADVELELRRWHPRPGLKQFTRMASIAEVHRRQHGITCADRVVEVPVSLDVSRLTTNRLPWSPSSDR